MASSFTAGAPGLVGAGGAHALHCCHADGSGADGGRKRAKRGIEALGPLGALLGACERASSLPLCVGTTHKGLALGGTQRVSSPPGSESSSSTARAGGSKPSKQSNLDTASSCIDGAIVDAAVEAAVEGVEQSAGAQLDVEPLVHAAPPPAP